MAGDEQKATVPAYDPAADRASRTDLNYYTAADINVVKGDFVKLRNMTLGYNLPTSLVNKAKLSSARVYVGGQNLAIITKYRGPDPEVSSNGNGNLNQGVDRNTVGNARTITVGLNIGF